MYTNRYNTCYPATDTRLCWDLLQCREFRLIIQWWEWDLLHPYRCNGFQSLLKVCYGCLSAIRFLCSKGRILHAMLCLSDKIATHTVGVRWMWYHLCRGWLVSYLGFPITRCILYVYVYVYVHVEWCHWDCYFHWLTRDRVHVPWHYRLDHYRSIRQSRPFVTRWWASHSVAEYEDCHIACRSHEVFMWTIGSDVLHRPWRSSNLLTYITPLIYFGLDTISNKTPLQLLKYWDMIAMQVFQVKWQICWRSVSFKCNR